MASQLTQALQAAAFNGDANATEYMKVQENTNFAVYIHQLCIELGSKDRDVRVRQLAGLQIKNAVDTRSVQAAQTLHNRWKALPDQARSQVKAMLLQILHDEIKDVRGVASLVIGKIASIEVPDKTWPELIPTLDQGITKQSTNMGLRQASLQALGYVCEEVPRGLDEYSSVILGAIAAGMNPAETDNDVKLAATTCLVNSIEFIKNNMDQEADRNNIMQMVFSVTSSPVEAVRAAAFSCLVQIANSYYKYLPPYMGTIFTLTASAIQGQSRDVALNALEFWSTVADVELECMEEDADGAEDPSHRSRSHGIINQAVQTFSPVLLASLTQQNEDIDDDEWGVSLAAGTCLGLCCQVAGNTLVQQALPFINSHVNSENWRFREAAILAFGCILDGPDKDKLLPLVQSAFGVILTKMNDSHPLVRDTTAWTIGRICSLLPEVIDQQNLRPLMDALASGLSQQPKIASNICWAIHNLASSVEPDESNPDTSVLSPYFEPIVGALLRASQRPDVKDANLQVSVYEALNIMITSAAPDVYALVEKVMPMIMTALDQTLKSGNPNAEAQNEIQALLCGTLQAIITKLPITTIQPQADALMTLFLSVLQSKNSTVHEEALMAVGSVADKVEDGFVKYMAYVKAPLMMGITNAQEWKVCNVAVSVTGDITRAVGPKFTEWSDDVMGVLLRHLQDSTVERTVKSYIIACIGDIALAVGSFFERYMQYVAPMLAQASKTTCDPEDWADVDYTEALRESILEAYSGILLGLAQDNKVAVFVQQRDVIPAIVDLFALIADDKNFTERVLRDAAGLIFDLVRSVGPQIVPTLRTPAVNHILTLACDEKERDNETLRNGLAARKSLQ